MSLLGDVLWVMLSRHRSRRALAAAFKARGWVLRRRWPLLHRAQGQDLNLGLPDLLHLQLARSRSFSALVVGAFDGAENDPAGAFLVEHATRAVFVEPQAGPCRRLKARLGADPRFSIVQAGVDRAVGTRRLYVVRQQEAGLPPWTQQLASFTREHILAHETQAPGVSLAVDQVEVATTTFETLLADCGLDRLDLLQIDAEGMDAQLLEWFPWHMVAPAVLCYEVAHMRPEVHAGTVRRLKGLGYRVFTSAGSQDDLAIKV